MTSNHFGGRTDRLISEPTFWLGIALYATVFAAAISVFGDTVPAVNAGIMWKANAGGTLAFGALKQTEMSDRCGVVRSLSNSHQARGALTLCRYCGFDFTAHLDWDSRNALSTAALLASIVNQPEPSTDRSHAIETLLAIAPESKTAPVRIALDD